MFKRKWVQTRTQVAALVASTLLLAACGGSSNGGSTNPPTSPPAPPTVAELNEASRLAAQATFGMSYSEIESIAAQGKENWIDSQFTVPISDHGSVVADLVRRRNAGEFAQYEQGIAQLTTGHMLGKNGDDERRANQGSAGDVTPKHQEYDVQCAMVGGEGFVENIT